MDKPDWTFAEVSTPQRGKKITLITRIGIVLALIDITVVAAAPLTRMYLDFPSLVTFRIFNIAALIGLGLAALGLLLTLIAAFMRVAPAWKRGLVMILIGVLPLGTVIMTIGPERFFAPRTPIHDISTDTTTPPLFIKAYTSDAPRRNSLDYGGDEIANQQLAAYPDIKPILSKLGPNLASNKVVQMISDLGWELTNVDLNDGIIEAYDTTRVFGFIDDVVIRVQAQDTGSLIDIRSVSRVGRGDAGQNAARIRKFTRALNE